MPTDQIKLNRSAFLQSQQSAMSPQNTLLLQPPMPKKGRGLQSQFIALVPLLFSFADQVLVGCYKDYSGLGDGNVLPFDPGCRARSAGRRGFGSQDRQDIWQVFVPSHTMLIPRGSSSRPRPKLCRQQL